jgi:hypothetical protein
MTNPQPPMPGQHAPHGYAPRPAKGGIPTWALVLVILAIVIFLFGGICAAIAVPAFTKYVRKSKTAEARVEVAKLFDGIANYYAEHGTCPTDGNTAGHAGVTPPLTVLCASGQDGRCVPNGSGPGGYPQAAWSENAVWQKLGYAQQNGHYFHYDVRWESSPQGCKFTVQAFGDLDEDGTFSTFERAAAADVQGINAATGIYIDNEVE